MIPLYVVLILTVLFVVSVTLVPVAYRLGWKAAHKAVAAKEQAAIEQAKELEQLEHDALEVPLYELVWENEKKAVARHLSKGRSDTISDEHSFKVDCLKCEGTRYYAGPNVVALERTGDEICADCGLVPEAEEHFEIDYTNTFLPEGQITELEAARVRAGLDSKENQEAKLKWFAEQGPEYLERMVKAGQMLPSYAERVLQYVASSNTKAISSTPTKPKVGDVVRPIGEMKQKYHRYDNVLNYWKYPVGFVIAEIDGEWFRIKNTTNWVSGPVAVVTPAPKQNEIAKHLTPTVKKCVVTDCTFPSLNNSKLCEYCKGIYDEDGEVMTSTSAPVQFVVGDKLEAIRRTNAYNDHITILFSRSVNEGYCGVVKEVSSLYGGRIKFAKYWYNAKDFKVVKRVKVKPQPRVAKG